MHHPGSDSPRTLKEMLSRVKNILKKIKIKIKNNNNKKHLELILSQIKQPTPMK